MAWFRVDDKLHSAPKLLSIPRKYRLAALGLWSMAGSWSADHLTDGVIPDYMIEEWGGTKTLVEWLINADLWEKVDGKTRFKNWDEYQPTKADVEEDRRKNREKLQKWRDRNKVGDAGVTKAVTRLQTESEPEDNPAPNPTQPDPPPLTEEEAKASSRPIETVDADPKPATYPPAFEAFWDAYPRKAGKKAAYAAFQKARKAATVQQLCTGAARYAADPNRDDPFTAMPATWLNRGSWEDDPLPDRNATTTPTRPTSAQTRAQAGLARLAAYDAANQPPRQLELGA